MGKARWWLLEGRNSSCISFVLSLAPSTRSGLQGLVGGRARGGPHLLSRLPLTGSGNSDKSIALVEPPFHYFFLKILLID